jgi:hypothetical protein
MLVVEGPTQGVGVGRMRLTKGLCARQGRSVRSSEIGRASGGITGTGVVVWTWTQWLELKWGLRRY